MDAKEIAAKFRMMADRIERNAEDTFGGAFVVIDPAGSIVETLILDGSSDRGQFWGMIKVKCDMELAEIDRSDRQGQAFQRR